VLCPTSRVHSVDVERLPFRVEGRLARVLGMQAGDLAVVQGGPDDLPSLRCVLPRPVTGKVSIVLRVHARTGIPLAYSSIEVSPGARGFETRALTLLAMEGYSHLAPADRQIVECRVWSRRAYATASIA
jgi:hypothetical protein